MTLLFLGLFIGYLIGVVVGIYLPGSSLSETWSYFKGTDWWR